MLVKYIMVSIDKGIDMSKWTDVNLLNNIETSDENIRRIYRFLLPVKY